MNSIVSAFNVLMFIMITLLLVFIVAVVIYYRWRASGQEKGI